MKDYQEYMDRQHIDSRLHEKLLSLPAQKRPRRAWQPWAVLAACFALVLGLSLGSLETAQMPRDGSNSPLLESDTTQFVVQGSGEAEKYMLPSVPYVAYPQSTDIMTQSKIALPEGAFSRTLTKADVQKLFWGPEGKPEQLHPKADTGDLPWMLFWDGYTVNGNVLYNGGGKMLWLNLFGEHPDNGSFHLQLAPGMLPPSCVAYGDVGTTEVFGVPVSGWSQVYDRDADGTEDRICISQFMAGDVGVRFENTGSPFRYGDEQDPAFFNSLLVCHALAGDTGLYLEHLLCAEDVPEWRSAEFERLAQARQEVDFAPYLPTVNMEGYPEFEGRLTYQQGNEHVLWVRWSRGYDDVHITVTLPEGERIRTTVDAGQPAAYDTRLYTKPWADSVPEEYRESFYSPDFHARDMTPDIIEARGTGKDTGGTAYRFGVLHENGVLVKYSCDGLTAQQVWQLVEQTLEKR